MALIDIKNLSFEYIGSFEPVFENLDLSLDTDWKLGFIGRNGYGKTTFLKLLMGEYKYEGSINKTVDMIYFPYKINNKDILTIDLLKELESNFEQWKLEKEMNLLDINIDRLYEKFSILSGGEQTKVLLALLFAVEDRFLLIDEPTNHLDTHGREMVARYLNGKKGFILVSHDRDFINNIVDHVLTIEKNKIVLQKGNYDTWAENKELEDRFELEKNEKLRKEIRRLKKSAREKSIWSDKVEATKIGSGSVDRGYIGHMAAKMMKRSKTLEKRYEKAIEDKEKLLKNIEEIESLDMNVLEHHAKQYISLENFSIKYNNKNIFEPIDFFIEPGDCIVLKGDNGTGKSSILKRILGENIIYDGNLEIAKGLKISYMPQKFDFVKGSINDFVENESLDKTMFLTILRKLGFSRSQFEIDIENFSMGQKKKILIAKSICEEANLFIWDEPLNYIDVISRIQIENMILEYAPTMILVEHDSRFIDRVATDIIELKRWEDI